MICENFSSFILNREFERKKKKNPYYSLRSFAKFLDINPATLSLILRSKRKLPTTLIDQISDSLDLTADEIKQLKNCVNKKTDSLKTLNKMDPQFKTITPPNLNEKSDLNNDTYFKILSQWEHFALLVLPETKDFNSRIDWIADKLKISPLEAEKALKRLVDANLLEITDEGKYRQTIGSFDVFSPNIRSKAIREGHKQSLQMAMKKVDKIPRKYKDFSSETMAINLKNLKKAKSLIRDFRKKIAMLLEDGEQEEVYQLNVQLYPLTDFNMEDQS